MRSNLIWVLGAALIAIHFVSIKKVQHCTKLTKADAYRNEILKG